jgi:hypothetical protein
MERCAQNPPIPSPGRTITDVPDPATATSALPSPFQSAATSAVGKMAIGVDFWARMCPATRPDRTLAVVSTESVRSLYVTIHVRGDHRSASIAVNDNVAETTNMRAGSEKNLDILTTGDDRGGRDRSLKSAVRTADV